MNNKVIITIILTCLVAFSQFSSEASLNITEVPDKFKNEISKVNIDELKSNDICIKVVNHHPQKMTDDEIFNRYATVQIMEWLFDEYNITLTREENEKIISTIEETEKLLAEADNNQDETVSSEYEYLLGIIQKFCDKKGITMFEFDHSQSLKGYNYAMKKEKLIKQVFNSFDYELDKYIELQIKSIKR